MRLLRRSAILAATLLAAGPALAQESPPVQRGRVYAQANCASCHAIGKYDESTLKIAPPFRELKTRYPVESLEESLAEGIVTGHPTMPQFRLDPGQVRDFVAYLKTL